MAVERRKLREQLRESQAKVSAADVTQFYQAKGLESPRGEALGRALRFCFQQQLQFGHRTRGELLQSYLER